MQSQPRALLRRIEKRIIQTERLRRSPSRVEFRERPLLNFQTDALRMTVELRGVHALHIGHSGLILSTVLNPD